MLRAIGLFLLGAATVGIAVLLFAVDLPVVDVVAVLKGLSLKQAIGLFTGVGAMLAVVYTGL